MWKIKIIQLVIQPYSLAMAIKQKASWCCRRKLFLMPVSVTHGWQEVLLIETDSSSAPSFPSFLHVL